MAYIELTLPDSYQEKYYSKWGLLRLKEVEDVLGSKPEWKVLTKVPKKNVVPWKSADSLFLYTLPHFCSEQYSPIYMGNNGQQVPLYLLPMPDRDTSGDDMAWSEYLYQWASSYRTHDGIWVGSGVLEMSAYKQIADPTSELNISGRDLCEEIESHTKIPTYYYLYRYFGRKKGETARPCPICGKPWRVERIDEKKPWWDFAFRCEPCRLVSNDASTDEDERHARIGEFRPINRMAEETTSHTTGPKSRPVSG
jgi:predicted  nucleic acid-binding Zn ribbon protein